MKVFKFNVWFEGDDLIEDLQERFVVASDEEEAEHKMEAHADNLKKRGFAQMVYVCKGVEIDEVII